MLLFFEHTYHSTQHLGAQGVRGFHNLTLYFNYYIIEETKTHLEGDLSMKLEKLLEKITPIQVIGSLDTDILSVEYDSRKVTSGSLFICIKGFQSDGHTYAQKAISMGAAALIVEDMPTFETTVPIIQVSDSRIALAYIAAAWFQYPAKKMTIIGLTGTKGKTTTAHMVKHILEEAGHKVGMIGTMGAYIGEKHITTGNTTPESYELHSLFAQMVDFGCTHVVMEAASQGFKLHRTAGITFDYGAFLNISPDHIAPGEHEDFQEYIDCKKLLFAQSKRTILNRDTDHLEELLASAKDPFTVSTSGDADLTASNIKSIWEEGVFGVSFDVSGAYNGRIVLNMPGHFNAENALIALAISYCVGIDFDVAAKALHHVTVKGRTQIIINPANNASLLIDYAHNALSMESLLTMLKAYHPKRLICLFGAGGNRAKDRRYDMGEIVGKYADLAIVTADNPRFESVASINADIVKGLEIHQGKYIIIEDRKEAIQYAIDHSRPGDIIALAGKGHEEYVEIEGKKYDFSEEKIILEYLK